MLLLVLWFHSWCCLTGCNAVENQLRRFKSLTRLDVSGFEASGLHLAARLGDLNLRSLRLQPDQKKSTKADLLAVLKRATTLEELRFERDLALASSPECSRAMFALPRLRLVVCEPWLWGKPEDAQHLSAVAALRRAGGARQPWCEVRLKSGYH